MREVYESNFITLEGGDFEPLYQAFLEEEQIKDRFEIRLIGAEMYQAGINRGKRAERLKVKKRNLGVHHEFNI